METLKDISDASTSQAMNSQPAIEENKVDMATPALEAGEKQTEQGIKDVAAESKEETKAPKASDNAAVENNAGSPEKPAKSPVSKANEPSELHDQPATATPPTTQPETAARPASVKPEHTEPTTINTTHYDIQEGYVLVAHSDAAGPSGTIDPSSSNGINNNNNTEKASITTPQAEPFLQDHADNTEHGQEVEHYDPNTPPARIQAYARLEFPFFNFYIQKLSVTIGRRPPVSRGASIAPKLVQQLDSEAVEVPPVEESKEPTQSKDAEKASRKPEETKDAEVAFKVKKEEEEKDEQPSASVEPSEAMKEPTVKPEETPRKMSTWDDRQQAENNAGPSTSMGPVADVLPQNAATGQTLAQPGPEAQTSAQSSDHVQTSVQAEQSGPASKSDKNQVDVDLGPIKAVSRNHARLFFDDTINAKSGLTNSWSLEVKGRNGLVLDGKWRAKGEIARLRNGSRIQIAERIFHFVLPNGVGYPTAPPSPVMDEYYDGQTYGYPPTPERSQSPIIYGSDSDELRSDNDDYGYGYDDDDMEMDSSAHGSTSAGGRNALPAFDENGNPIKRKRGRPKKQRTAEQLAAMELEKQRRLDPTIPRRPRGRPPKNKKDEESQQLQYTPIQPQPPVPAQQQQQTQTTLQSQSHSPSQPQRPPQPPSNTTSAQQQAQQAQPPVQVPKLLPSQLQPIPYASARVPAPDIPVPQLVPLGTSLPPGQQQAQNQQQVPPPPIPLGGLEENGKPRLSKREQADLRKAQKQAEREEKQRIKEAEKKAREEAKAAAKEAKAREIAEKKRKEEERKKAAAEEAKRLQEERQKAAERDRAEKEKLKLAAAAAAAELKAKTIADAQAKARAEAEARAARDAENKAKLGGGVGNEVKIRPAPAPQSSTPVPQSQPPPAKKATQPKQQVQPQQPAPSQQQTPAPQPFIPTNQFQGKPEKPPYSYPALIAQAIWAAPNRQAPLQHIHAWIPDKYPFFRDPAHAQILAQAIKQNLAVNRAFVNIPLPSGVALWAIEPEQSKLFDGNTFLPPPNAQSMPYHPPPIPQQHYYQPPPPLPPQSQLPLQQPIPIQPHYPMQQQQQQQMYSASPAPMMSPPINPPVHRVMNGMAASASPAPMPVPVPSQTQAPIPTPMMQPSQPLASPIPPATASPAPPAPTPAPAAAPAASSSSSSKMPILIARPSASYAKPAPPTSAAANDPSSMLDPEGYPPIAIHDSRMYLSPTVFSALTAQQLSNLQSIETKQALNILQAFVVNYFKVELKKRKKAEKAALKGLAGGAVAASGTPMSASPSPAPSGMKRHAADDPMGGNEAKIQKVS